MPASWEAEGDPVTPTKEQVVDGLVAELRSFHGLNADLTAEDSARPTRCEAWTVGDLAAHVTGVMADITAGRLEGIDTQDWYDRQVRERRGRTPRELTDELGAVIIATDELMGSMDQAAWDGPGPPGVAGTLGRGVESLWCGIYIHREDVLAALDRPPARGNSLEAAISYIADVLTDRGWGPATLALEGVEEFTIGGGGPRISGDPLVFALVATGRTPPGVLSLDESVNIFG
jgi:uncharacterized protein (TIGR03083 family)